MFTVQDIIHLIQYYYLHSSYDEVNQDVEQFQLESLRGVTFAVVLQRKVVIMQTLLTPFH